MFKLRLDFLRAINRVAGMFGEFDRVEAALWWIMDRVRATDFERQVLLEAIMKRSAESSEEKT